MAIHRKGKETVLAKHRRINKWHQNNEKEPF